MSEANSSRTPTAVFMANATETKINALSDAARGLFLTLHSLGPKTGNNLCRTIADMISPEMMFNRGTAPFPFLWTELRNF